MNRLRSAQISLNANPAGPTKILAKATFCLLTVLLAVGLTLVVHWSVGFLAFWGCVYVYGLLRPYLIGPPSEQEYAELYTLFYSRKWAVFDGKDRKAPRNVSERTRFFAEILGAIDRVANHQRANGSAEEVDAWYADLKRWCENNSAYAVIIERNARKED